jgi:signal transduction histidine kinase
VINDILDISKIEAGKMVLDRADFDVEATLRKAVGIVSQAARDKGLALMLDVEGLPAWANGDATRRAALVNYLAMPSNYRARFDHPAGPGDRGRDSDTLIRFAVIDSGIGIAPRQLRAFSRHSNRPTRRPPGVTAAPASAWRSPRPWPN